MNAAQEKLGERLKERFKPDLDANVKEIIRILGHSVDISVREFELGGNGQPSSRGAFISLEGLTDVSIVEGLLEGLLEPRGNEGADGNRLSPKEIGKRKLVSPSISTCEMLGEGISGIVAGDTLVMFEEAEEALLVCTRAPKERAIEEPSSENNVRGPRDGFTECIRSNTAMVRRRLKDPMLRFEGMVVGERSRTDVNVAYIADIAKEELVAEVRRRLQRIKIDAILESGNIEELIEDSPLSPFDLVQSTERPDRVASALLEGRVAIFIDTTPFVLIVPTFFWQYFQAPDDYYHRFWVGTFFRLVRYVAFLISLLLPSIYVMLVSFHHEMIPTSLALTIASGREVVPFPVLLEALIMEFAFELMREAGLRMPKPIGQAVSIVGSLIIGQAAVQAGLISPFMVIIVAVTGISSFATPSYSSSLAIRLLRFPLLLASGMLGLLGFTTMFFIILLHALSLRSFGVSYLTPASPYRPSDQRDMVLRVPIWMMDERPETAKDKQRMGEMQMPAKPKEGGA
ncbi:spore germination protein [Paenibacillus sp. LHD-117]|uniref:spore germination protein n=1 Tax=Paenibacillus sp. LHD-117 TaxID=3071412 RepID=UPI0027E1F4FF|nr:spore germination protein [Paenibacillus sp. LHD-117]MDQ6422433.1 spore germination protein [Paenibacillus sp. LHD-117]